MGNAYPLIAIADSWKLLSNAGIYSEFNMALLGYIEVRGKRLYRVSCHKFATVEPLKSVS